MSKEHRATLTFPKDSMHDTYRRHFEVKLGGIMRNFGWRPLGNTREVESDDGILMVAEFERERQ